MKKIVSISAILFLLQLITQAQPSNYYIFKFYGSCNYGAEVSTWPGQELIIDIPDDRVPRTIYYPAQSSFYLSYQTSDYCPTTSQICDFPMNTTYCMLNNEYPTEGGVQCYWSPIVSSLSAREYSTGYSSPINANSNQHPIPTRDIFSNRIIEVLPTSDYTGSDYQWQIKTGVDEVIFTVSGGYFRMSARDIASRIGYNTDFWIQPRTPDWTISETDMTPTYRNTWHITQKLRIYQAQLTAEDDPECVKNYIKVTITSSHTQTIDLRVLQQVYMVGYDHDIPGHTGFTINPGITTRYVYYDQIKQTPIDFRGVFGFGLYIAGSDNYMFSEHAIGNQYFEPLSTLTIESISFCPEDINGGTLILKRNPGYTNFEERFDFREAENCSTAIGIDPVYMAEGKDSIHVFGFSEEPFCIGRVRVIGDSIQCLQTRTYSINPYPKPEINSYQITSPWCQYDNASVDVKAGTLNGQRAPDIYLFNGDSSFHLVDRDYVAQFSGLNIEAEPYYTELVDAAGCRSDRVTIPRISYPDINFSIDEVPPNCYGAPGGTLTFSGATGGPDGTQFEYSIGSGFQSNPVFPGLFGGIPYTVTARDKNHTVCLTSKTESIWQPPQLLFLDPAYAIDNIECFGDFSDGSIRLYGIGGTEPLYYNFASGSNLYTVGINETITGVPAGIYEGWISDKNGCTTDTIPNLEITESPRITIRDFEITEESCLNTFDGSIEITEVHGGGGGYTYKWSNGQTNGTATSLHAGNYRLTVTDDLECDIDTIFVLNAPHPIQASVSTFIPVCQGEATGYMVINSITNGNPGYTCSIQEEGPYYEIAAGDTICGLKAGDYKLFIRDSKYNDTTFSSCSGEINFTIPDKQRIESLQTDIDIPLCFGDSNAVINIGYFTGPGDTSKYTFEWRDEGHILIGQSRHLINIPSGTYEVTLFDEQGCASTSFGDIVVEDPPKLLIDSIRIDSASCIEVPDGSITVFPSGGTKANYYQYSIGDDFLLNHPVFSDLNTGIYSLSVSDDNGCVTSVDTTLEAGKVVVALTDTSMVTCFGDKDGSIELTTSGGKGVYRYFIDGPGLQTDTPSSIFTGLDPGLYHIYAHDENTTCESVPLDIAITEPDPIVITTILVDSASCGQSTGSISYTVVGGNGGNIIRWEDTNGNIVDETDLNALATDIYTISVVDKKACAAEATISVPEREGPEITGFKILDSTWCDMPLGRVEITVEKGSPAFHYTWAHQAGLDSPIAYSLRAGTYDVTITDRYNCFFTYTFDLEDGPALEPSSTITDANCNMNNGTALMTVSGGVPPYLYQWPDSISATAVSDPYMDNLYAGDYEVIVSDDIGCDTAVFVSISNLEGPKVQTDKITSAWCGLATGTASVNVSGNDPPFTYVWHAYGSNEILSNLTSVDSLKAGNYVFRVTDIIGCIDIQHIIIADSAELEPDLLFVSMDSSACSKPLGALSVEMTGGLPPYYYLWNSSAEDTLSTASALTAGIYEVTATDTRGCKETLEREVVDRKPPAIGLLAVEDAYCGKPTGKFFLGIQLGREPYLAYLSGNPGKTYPFIYTDSIGGYVAVIDSLFPKAALYSIRGADADGCESNTLSNYIDNENPMHLTLINLLPVSCFGGNDGKASILVEEGIEPYVYQWSKNSVNSAVNNNLSAGKFTVTVTDALNCKLSSASYTISEPTQVRITNAIITEPACYGMCDGQITGYASGGTGQLRYIWNHQDTVRTITGLCAGEIYLEVLDANICSASRYLTMDEPPMISETDMPDNAEVCEGQNYILAPDEEYSACSWTSNNGFTSNSRVITITEQGDYYFSASSPEGCAVVDTFTLVVSDNLLDAEFLMASEAYVGDTVVIIEVSWPYADICSWNIPPEATILTDLDYYKELTFRSPGTYYIELNARLATCVAMQGKYIDIYNSTPDKSSDDPGDDISSIISSFIIYPNPVRENLTLKVKLTEEKDIRVEMVSLSGKMVNNTVIGYDMSEYEVSLDVTSLMPGMYIIRLIAGDNIETKMLVVH